MGVRKVCRFQMRPTAEQEQMLSRFAGARRWVWNWGLARTKAYYAEHGKGIGRIALSAELTALKAQLETAGLKEADSQLLQQTLLDLHRAYENFFERRTRFPRFKAKKRDAARFRIPQRVTVSDGAVSVPKVGRVRIRQSQPIDGTTKSATFKRDATGKWSVSLNVAIEMPDVALPPADEEGVVGIDLGLKDFAVLSDGERMAAPKFYRRRERKLRRASKAFSRTQKGSVGRAKARKRVALVHRKTSNQRRDFLHKLSTRLVKAHTGLCIEDLSLKGMMYLRMPSSEAGYGLVHSRNVASFQDVHYASA